MLDPTGAAPRWLLTTLLFPVGSTPSQIAGVVHDLDADGVTVVAFPAPTAVGDRFDVVDEQHTSVMQRGRNFGAG